MSVAVLPAPAPSISASMSAPAAPAGQNSTSSSTEEDALKAATFQRLHPRLYLERFLAEDVRPDGRAEDEFRGLAVNVGSITNADGSALVRLGDTTVVCGVKAEIAEPELDKPNEGFIVPNLDLPAICSPKFKPGPPSDEAQVLSDRLHEVLISASIISASSLVIEPGKAVWVLYVDATCVNYDGNVFDAALVAMIAALRNTKLPKATFNEETGRTTCSRKTKVPLNIEKLAVPSSWGIFNSKHILADPTAFEEPLLETTVSVIIDQHGALLSATQLGEPLALSFGSGTDVGMDVLPICIDAAQARARELVQSIYPA